MIPLAVLNSSRRSPACLREGQSVRLVSILAVLFAHGAIALSAPGRASLDLLPNNPRLFFQMPTQTVNNDTGINVLIDLSHQMAFRMCWAVPPLLREHGFRVVGSQAAIDAVLTRGSRSRVRVDAGGRRPFGWITTPPFNVVMTYQSDPDAQPYLPQEVAALKMFVRKGGGLIIIGGGVHSAERLQLWPLNTLAVAFDASITNDPTKIQGANAGTLRLTKEWKTKLTGDNGGVVLRRADVWERTSRDPDCFGAARLERRCVERCWANAGDGR